MFSQASAILFTRGWCVSQHALWQTPPKADTPLADPHHPLGRHPPGRHPQADPLDRHPLCPVHAGIYPLPSACWDAHTPCPVHAGIHTPLLSACWDTTPTPKAATAADGTHPTGRHSCFYVSPLMWNSYSAENLKIVAFCGQYKWNKSTKCFKCIAQVEFKLAYGPGATQMLMPWPLIEY